MQGNNDNDKYKCSDFEIILAIGIVLFVIYLAITMI